MTRLTGDQIRESAQRSPGPATDIVASEGRGAIRFAPLQRWTSGGRVVAVLVVAIAFSMFGGIAAAIVTPATYDSGSSLVDAGTRSVDSWQISAPPETDPDAGQHRAMAPVAIRIPSIRVDARVVPLGLNADGTVQVPTDVSKVGWYAGNVPPGVDGAAVLIGHLDSKVGPAVFYRLATLKPGAVITIERADRSVVRFAVQIVSRFKRSLFPTASVYGSVTGSHLRLITCGGAFDRRTRHYLDNTVVYATLIHGRAPAPALVPTRGGHNAL